jgi:phosphohistidine phosphatase
MSLAEPCVVPASQRQHSRNLNRVSDNDRTLVLLRHAKSAYPDGVADHERPLAPRGEREAGLAGDWLRTHLPPIDAVLCSTATRTRKTLARTGMDAPVRYIERLYEATAGTVIGEINGVSDDVSVLLVIGHEPTMTEVALGLANPDTTNADADAAERISTKFPTDIGRGSAAAKRQLDGPRTRVRPASRFPRAALTAATTGYLQISTIFLILSSRF